MTIGPETLTQLIVYWNTRCVLTLDSTTGPLIPILAMFAKSLEVKIDHAKRRKFTTPFNEALDPALRIRYDFFRHVKKSDRMNLRRSLVTPLNDLAERVGNFPCAFHGPAGRTHASLGKACDDLTPDFRRANFICNVTFRDSYGVTRGMIPRE